MSDDDWDDDEDDEDDEDAEAVEEEFAPCPECGAKMLVDAELCPSCGYWLSTAERHALWSGGARVGRSKSVVKVTLVIVLIVLLSGLAFFF